MEYTLHYTRHYTHSTIHCTTQHTVHCTRCLYPSPPSSLVPVHSLQIVCEREPFVWSLSSNGKLLWKLITNSWGQSFFGDNRVGAKHQNQCRGEGGLAIRLFKCAYSGQESSAGRGNVFHVWATCCVRSQHPALPACILGLLLTISAAPSACPLCLLQPLLSVYNLVICSFVVASVVVPKDFIILLTISVAADAAAVSFAAAAAFCIIFHLAVWLVACPLPHPSPFPPPPAKSWGVIKEFISWFAAWSRLWLQLMTANLIFQLSSKQERGKGTGGGEYRVRGS